MKRQHMELLFITALEGGSNYWYNIEKHSDLPEIHNKLQLSYAERLFRAIMDYGYNINITDVETREWIGSLSKKAISIGTTKFEMNFPAMANEIENEDFDAETADIWFQHVVLGEIVYG